MMKRYSLVYSALLGASLLMSAQAYSASLLISAATATAPTTGYAGVGTGTTGGSTATSAHIYQVKNRTQLLAAIEDGGTSAKIIQVIGTIDMTDGTAYTSATDQKARGQIPIPSNTTLIGTSASAKITNGNIVLTSVSNVIIRNLYIESPVDVAPVYESGDGWNAEWDCITISGSDHVWVDHVTFSDGSFTDDEYTTKNGEKYVQHDGMFDVKKGSDYVTVSYSIFENHDKTSLIGHSDSNSSQDTGKLHVTYHHNLFQNIEQRAPRVRFGTVHAYNNAYVGDKNADVYAYQYSFGIGKNGSVYSEGNYFALDGITDGCKVVKSFSNGNLFKDSGSVLNGSDFALSSSCSYSTSARAPSYKYSVTSAASAYSTIKSQAGVGKI